MDKTKALEQQIKVLEQRIESRQKYQGGKLLSWFETPAGEKYLDHTHELQERLYDLRFELMESKKVG
jgi:peptidoglycan hydrolase CwlO-like protein